MSYTMRIGSHPGRARSADALFNNIGMELNVLVSRAGMKRAI